MDLRDAAAVTFAAIRTHKLRTVLAATGVVLGIAAVIAVVTMGAGLQQSVLGLISGEFEGDVIFVSVQEDQPMNGPPVPINVYAFTDRDLDAIAGLEGVDRVGAEVPLMAVEVLADGEPVRGVRVIAERGSHFGKFDAGREVHNDDEATVSNATARTLAQALGVDDVLGLTLTLRLPAGDGVNVTNVTIVGVEAASAYGGPPSLRVGPGYAPLTPINGTPQRMWEGVTVWTGDPDTVQVVKARIQDYLETGSDARHLKGNDLIFRYDTREDVLSLINQGVGQFTAFIGAIGGVSLLVGLVGIANIMLVSVSERTRDIGVMKATGATRGDVLLIFLTESIAICLVGAVLGILLGGLLGYGLGQVMSAFTYPPQALPFVFLPEWYAIAVAMGVGVGLIAGIYPAWRAAKVSPVEALRYE